MSGTPKKLRLPALVGIGLIALLLAAVQPASGQRTPAAESAARTGPLVPVPSLEPRSTERLWRTLVRHRASRVTHAAGDCLPLRAVFYAATDWLRLATRLAANPSPCAAYHISIPPLVADKTQPRPDQAWRIRALGPAFHAQAEISWNAWSAWVAAGSGTWHEAGVEARRRMASAGYDVALGDGWALNELSSAVRRGDGAARANARELLRGLYEADGTLPRSRGTAFMVGIGQGTAELATYTAHLQNWLQDASFWAEMGTYVQDWSQESYGDVRNYAVPGAPLAARRDALSAYLGHSLSLARAGPDAVGAARAFLQSAYSPLANAAWEWDASFGWTAVPVAQMKDFVSAQTYALRHVDAGGGPDRGGFAWAPRNAGALSASEYAAQTGELLDRLAAAIRDSVEGVDPSDPGGGACAPTGTNLWCLAELPGSAFNGGWAGFTSWTQPAAGFATPSPTLTAGAPSPPIVVQLQLAGVPQLAPLPIAVELSSSSPTGAFATSPDGPWSPTLAISVGAGTSTGSAVYYLDTVPGAPTLSVRGPGGVGAQVAIVQPAPTSGGGTPVDLVLTGRVEDGDGAAAVGETVGWLLRVDDRTLAPAAGVYLDVGLPAGHAFVGGSSDRGAGCTPSGPTQLRCSLDFLNAAAPAANVILTTRVQATGTHVLTAAAGFDGSDPTPADNVLSLQSVTAPTRSPAGPAAPGRVVRRGTPGADALLGGPGNDELRGLGGSDVLRGLAGDDRLDGGAGADVLVGGPGRDRLLGASGNDVLRARDGWRDAIACGPGRDLVVADRADRIGVGCERVSRR